MNIIEKIKFRLRNVRDPMNLIWVIFIAYNAFGLVTAILDANMSGALINGVFLFIMLMW